MKWMRREADSFAHELSGLPWVGGPARREDMRRRIAVGHFTALANLKLIGPNGHVMRDGNTQEKIFAVDYHSNMFQQQKLQELQNRADTDPDYNQIFQLARYIHQQSAIAQTRPDYYSQALPRLRDESIHAYRMSLLGAIAKKIKEDHMEHHIKTATAQVFSRTLGTIQIAANISSLGTTVAAEHILKHTLGKYARHIAERIGLRRLVSAFEIPVVFDHGRWIYVIEETKQMKKALEDAQGELAVHHEGLANQLLTKRGLVDRVTHFKDEDGSKKQLIQLMEAIYYLTPYYGPVVPDGRYPGRYKQLSGFRELNKSVAVYDYYVAGLEEEKQRRAALEAQKQKRK